jgi:polyphosphate kinase
MSKNQQQFLNRELSWLEFNSRVLEEARDSSLPLLERLKFLAISGSNLDEFFMVRVGGLRQLLEEGKIRFDPAGLTTGQQLTEISRRTHRLVEEQYACLIDELDPQLAEAGIHRARFDLLSPQQAEHAEQVFTNDLYPVITPMAIHQAETFATLPGLVTNLIVRLPPDKKQSRQARYAIIRIPKNLPRYLTLPADKSFVYIHTEDLVAAFVERFFPGESIEECVPFRITRNADMAVREDLAGDLLSHMRAVLDARKFSACVRLEIGAGASRTTRGHLQKMLDVSDEHVYDVPGPIDTASFMSLATMPGFDHLKIPSWPPQPHPVIQPGVSMFDVLTRQDVLLYHPYDSFEPVVRLIDQAADDPDVLAIKQILYRTSKNSPIIAALERAATKGKHVTALVELKARFDEARNIEWARALERAGVQVIYGLKWLKVHAKLCLIVRREPSGIRRYCHFGTGNYNEITAQLYSDVSYMTADEDLGADATAFFNTVTAYSQPIRYRKIDAAPLTLRSRLLQLIESETQRQRQGQEARIMAKINSLVDPEIIEALCEASQAGVPIQLNVRGICCLRPGVPGLSENITVTSILDRYLEHARIIYFHHGGEQLLYISSADWMPRNLDRRVELLTPIGDPVARARLIEILGESFRDNVKARRLMTDGRYERVKAESVARRFRFQEQCHRRALTVAKEARDSRYQQFQPQRPKSTG